MSKELSDLFKSSEISEAQNFNSIKITLASPEKIKSWTFGEIKKTTEMNHSDVKLCALLDNVASSQKIDFRGKSINKSIDPLWYIFPWENWW